MQIDSAWFARLQAIGRLHPDERDELGDALDRVLRRLLDERHPGSRPTQNTRLLKFRANAEA